jgi:hypothetical protein
MEMRLLHNSYDLGSKPADEIHATIVEIVIGTHGLFPNAGYELFAPRVARQAPIESVW